MKEVLISIRYKWTEKIFSGEKTLEIRKTCPRSLRKSENHPHTFYVYEPKSGEGCGMVVGRFECKNIIFSNVTDKPFILTLSCLTKDELKKYVGDSAFYAYIISNPHRFREPIPLEGFGIKVPPQSWRYII